MPIRKFNYTARQRIRRSDVDIRIRRSPGSPAEFDASLDLRAYALSPDAKVFVEAYRQTTVMRFPWGSASVLLSPESRVLSDFDGDVRILFRAKVTDVSGRPGVLLAVADRLHARETEEQPDRRIPLLPPEPDDLGEELWRVDFEGEPALLVNRDVPDWKAMVRAESFRALVYPAALRTILTRILLREGYAATDDFDDWRSRWLQFAVRIPGAGGVPNAKEQYEDWIESAVAAFARRFGMRTRHVAAMVLTP